MSLSLVTPATAEPVSLRELKDQCRLEADFTDEDSYLQSLVAAAREYVEDVTWLQLMPASYLLTIDGGFPCRELYLPKPPLQSVTSIKYLDSDGAEQTVSPGIYGVDAHREPGRVYLAYGQSWPTCRSVEQAVRVTFVAGYANEALVPERLKQAIKILAATWYEHREQVITGTIVQDVPFAVTALLSGLVRDERTLEHV